MDLIKKVDLKAFGKPTEIHQISGQIKTCISEKTFFLPIL
jgi:hypothetical protein